ncbi:double-stranded RNA-binding protein Staufen homolog 2-like isoform X1 [Schistocerca cancellata]|uniref:double-stranded RNA-binding protein Staufen homolog 2-like isoform X1 n=2 Tax=Schistocerca cancellata TaxID=274614 RepID=UPI0021181FE2|nr:double-stranded RNA-binding protein Staufen homolog 2-like isoform X1 [Schistocerca cancellata]
MLHHQQTMPIPPNQLRDASRLGQVPMRLPQQQQQRQPLIMGMQPPASGAHGSIVTLLPAPVMPPTALAPQQTTKNPAAVMLMNEGESTRQQHAPSQSGTHCTSTITVSNTATATTATATSPSPSTSTTNATSSANSTTTSTNLANTKEKTPMCLVNELARFNKIQHQYRLTNEQGPPHKKRFTVTLKLGDEEYSAEGASIKKAQHSAASEALQHTQYKHPPPKTSRNIRTGKSNITPTVELNALAMKRGEPAVYTFIEPPHNGTPHNMYLPPPPHNFNYRGMYNQVRGYPFDQNRRGIGPRPPPYPGCEPQRFHHYGKIPAAFHPPMFYVSLRVGSREFIGEGMSGQAAKHDAASKALSQLRNLPLPEETIQQRDGAQENGNCLDSDPNADLKSPISLVHEIALKRNLPVNFVVESEKGPPHMRTFVTKCTVGDKVTTGQGNGKKLSKKRAAEKMLEELKKLPPSSPTNLTTSMSRLKRRANPGKKKTRNLIKVYQQEQKGEPEYGEDIHPVTRLILIQQAKKMREPVYTLVEERGVPRRREFVMEVTLGQHTYQGTGSNKKLAKRAAAEGLLQLLGYSRPVAQPAKPSIKTGEAQESDKNRKVTFLDEEKTPEMPAGGSSGRQLVPGLLLMSDNNTTNGYNQNTPTKVSGVNIQTTAAIAKELLIGGNSPTAEALAKSAHSHKNVQTTSLKPPTPQSQGVRPKDQLLYLAQLLGFQVQFSDFPKGNHSEFLSLVSLSTDPPQVCHGAGSTTDASHDQAALTALRALSEMGLDSVSSSGGTVKKEQSQGDGLHLNQQSIHKAGGISLTK